MKIGNVLSLFDGISCGQLALKRAGIEFDNYYASEIDKYAIQVTQKNFPNTIQLGSVTDVWAKNLPKIDLLIGGTPCQDLSIAKANRKGLKGERSGLFWHYVRLLRTCKPKWFLLENVASMSKESKEEITKVMGVEPILINSALLSAQQRKRLYWTNIPNIIQPQDKGIILQDILESGKECKQKTSIVCEPICVNSQSGRGGIDGLQPSLQDRIYSYEGKMSSLTQIQSKIAEPYRIGQLGKGGQGQRIYSVRGKSVSLSANGGGQGAKTGLYKIDLPDGEYTIRKLTPVECERLQTLPDNYTEGISNTQRYKCIGNGWTVDVIAHIFSFMKESVKMKRKIKNFNDFLECIKAGKRVTSENGYWTYVFNNGYIYKKSCDDLFSYNITFDDIELENKEVEEPEYITIEE